MSSQIFYERVYIKLPDDRYIPLFLNGSSNTYEGVGCHERRERNWTEFRPKSAQENKQYILTRAQIEELAEEARGWPYSGMCIRSYGRFITEEEAYRYILGGLRRTFTIEEISDSWNTLSASLLDAENPWRYKSENLGSIRDTESLLSLFEQYPNDRLRLHFSTYSAFRWPKNTSKAQEMIQKQGYAFVLCKGSRFVQKTRKSKRGTTISISDLNRSVRQFARMRDAESCKSRYMALHDYSIEMVAVPSLQLMQPAGA